MCVNTIALPHFSWWKIIRYADVDRQTIRLGLVQRINVILLQACNNVARLIQPRAEIPGSADQETPARPIGVNDLHPHAFFAFDQTGDKHVGLGNMVMRRAIGVHEALTRPGKPA